MRIPALLLATLLALPAHATVKMAAQGITADGSRATELLSGQSFHPVRVDRDSIESSSQSGELLLPGLGGAPVRARLSRLERREDGLSVWIGKVDTRFGEQSVVLTLGEGVAFGLIPQYDGLPLRLETRKGTAWLVEGQSPDPAFDAGGIDFMVPPAEPDSRSKRARQDALKVLPEPVVEVVVAYNATLVNVMGSDAAVQARITYLEALSNQAYVDSQAEIRIRVVAKHLVDYSLNNDNSDALNEITNPSSLPIKIEMDRIRSLYGADLVSLLRNFDRSTQNSCGIAWILGFHGQSFNAPYGFSVVSDRGFGGDNCGEWTFAHELGHNMGAHHDTETTEDDYGAYVYSRGLRKTLSPTSGFATIMAYTVSPQTRLGYFSNPRISACLSLPCGDAATADNARGLGEAAPAMASLVAALPPTSLPSLTMDDVSVTEGNSGTKVVTFTVRLSAASATPVTFNLSTVNGSARAPLDFVALLNAPRQIPAGQTSATFDVTVRGDTVVEQDEVFGLNVSSVNGARVVDGQAVATIVNDEPIPDLTIADVNVDEGNAGITLATFTVTLAQSSGTPVTFSANSFRYADGPNAATENVDFEHISLDNLVIPAGATTAQFTARVIGETLVEQDESFYVNLSNVTAANVVDGRSNVWIRNDDGVANRPGISIADATVVEGNAGTSVATFNISLSQPAPSQVRFGVATSDGTAEAGTDYVAKLTPLQTIAAGQTNATFTVTINGDVTAEGNEFFNVSLFNVNGADVVDAQAVGNITNDDAGGLATFAVRDDRVVMRVNAPPATINVRGNDVYTASRLDGGSLAITTPPAQGTASVQTNSTAGTASDDTIRFTPGANFSGETLVGYRLCEGGAGARCADGILSIVLRPSVDVAIDTPSGAGFLDLPMADQRALPAAEFIAHSLRAPQVSETTLAVDPSPETPWDSARLGTFTRTVTLSSGPVEWRLLADARSLAGGDVDLYLGVDLDGDATPDANEVRCTAAMSPITERCELALGVLSSGATYWVMLHNRSATAHAVRLDLYDYPMQVVETGSEMSNLVATGPGKLAADADFPLRLGWTDYDTTLGERHLAYVRVKADAGTDAGVFPLVLTRSASEVPPVQLNSGQFTAVALPAGGAQDRMYIDVPAGATSLNVSTSSNTANIDLYLAFVPSPSGPGIAPAPARNLAVRSAVTASGNESITLLPPTLVAGRWYVTPVNSSASAAQFSVLATIAGSAPPIRAGSYFNAARGGHGLFVYPAGSQRVGLWYTYLQDGSPTWYYLQGAAPGANGLWYATLYRSAWTGTANKLTAIGKATVTPTGADAFTFAYTLDGETGTEPLTALGRGCPTLGTALDVSSHWFNPAAAGSGYSVQMLPNYEFHASFVYDGRGVPRFLLAERAGFGGTQATLTLEQLQGFCPLCTRTGNPTRAPVGTYVRNFAGGSFSNIAVNATFIGLPGAWVTSHPVQLLGGPGSAQGCTVP